MVYWSYDSCLANLLVDHGMVYIADEGDKQRGAAQARACSRWIVQFIASVESQGTAVSPAHLSAIFSVLCRSFIFWTYKKYLQNMKARGPPPVHEGGGTSPTSWAPWRSSDLNSNSIYLVSERKNQREEFIAFYDTELPSSPVLPREGRSRVHSGLRRGEFVAIVIINHPSSPISWCSPPCVSNSIVGLLDRDGLDEIYHVIELVLLGFDP